LHVKEAGEHNFNPDGKQEEQECVVILNSYTIINPWTMVVKSLNTLVEMAQCLLLADLITLHSGQRSAGLMSLKSSKND